MHSLFFILDLVIDEQSPDEDERVALSFLRESEGKEHHESKLFIFLIQCTHFFTLF